MFKKISFLAMLFFSAATFAKDYVNAPGYIHSTTIKSQWCGNLGVSTKVGHLSDAGKCIYEKETASEGVDTCDPLLLNGYLLELNAGSGFNCAATHVHSNVTGHDGLDEYLLISDDNHRYVNTKLDSGDINLG
jgi:hypothetical protein